MRLVGGLQQVLKGAGVLPVVKAPFEGNVHAQVQLLSVPVRSHLHTAWQWLLTAQYCLGFWHPCRWHGCCYFLTWTL